MESNSTDAVKGNENGDNDGNSFDRGNDDDHSNDVLVEIISDQVCQYEREMMKTMGLPCSFAISRKHLKVKGNKSNVKAKRQLPKYWHQRYRLFSRFDEGIKLDKESWYSVTPEMIASHIAQRCCTKAIILMDPFCGVGGNIIQFALASKSVHVIASDIDPKKIRMAMHNAKIYGVADQISFFVGDFFQIIETICLPVDCIFLSPPWGGPDYLQQENYSLNDMKPNGIEIYKAAKNVTNNIAFLLPRNIDREEMNTLLKSGEFIEIEENLINKKPKTVTAYFGNLVVQ